MLSAADPVRVFQQFATLDLISKGRIDLVVGRGSFTEAFPLFGLDLADYDTLFAEKLDLLLKIRESRTSPGRAGTGRRSPGRGSTRGPLQDPLPIWVGVGGTPESFVRAGLLGLPLMVAIIGGEPRQFAPLVDLYRRAGAQAGHAPEELQVGLHVFGFVADSTRPRPTRSTRAGTRCSPRSRASAASPPPTRAQFDATSGPDGAFFMGDPDTVATKLRRVSDQLGGVDRISLQMTNPRLAHADLLRGIELLGTEVVPRVAAGS